MNTNVCDICNWGIGTWWCDTNCGQDQDEGICWTCHQQVCGQY